MGRRTGYRGVRQWLPSTVGGFHSPRACRYAVAPRPVRGRQGRAARRVGIAELGRAPLGRRTGVEPVWKLSADGPRMTSVLLPASGRRIERYALRHPALTAGGGAAP